MQELLVLVTFGDCSSAYPVVEEGVPDCLIIIPQQFMQVVFKAPKALLGPIGLISEPSFVGKFVDLSDVSGAAALGY